MLMDKNMWQYVPKLQQIIKISASMLLAGEVAERNTGGADISYILFYGIVRGSLLYSRHK